MKLTQALKYLDLDLATKQDFEINTLSTLEDATQNDIAYVDQNKYLDSLKNTKAGAVFLREEHANMAPQHTTAIAVKNPHLCFALLSGFFAKSEFGENGESAIIAKSAKIMPNVFLGKNVKIGENTTIMPGVVISDDVLIGENCKIYPNVVIYRDTIIGDNVNIHAGSVIGCDGFGYAHTNEGKHIKIEHNGIVIIENDVEIGANTTIDRAVFGQTKIGNGAKIDNLVQIAHNCKLGDNTILVSQVGLAGSTTTGRNVVMGGQAGTGGHIHIGEFTTIAGRGAVGKNLPPNTKWGGHPLMKLDEWIKFYVTLRRMIKK